MNFYNIFPSVDFHCFLLLLVIKTAQEQLKLSYSIYIFPALSPRLEHKMKDQQQKTTGFECPKIQVYHTAFNLFSFPDWFISVSLYFVAKKLHNPKEYVHAQL